MYLHIHYVNIFVYIYTNIILRFTKHTTKHVRHRRHRCSMGERIQSRHGVCEHATPIPA